MNLIKQNFIDELAAREVSESLRAEKIKRAQIIAEKQREILARHRYWVLNYLKRKMPNVINRSIEVPQEEFDKLLKRAHLHYSLQFLGSLSLTVSIGWTFWLLSHDWILKVFSINIDLFLLIFFGPVFFISLLVTIYAGFAYFHPEEYYKEMHECEYRSPTSIV